MIDSPCHGCQERRKGCHAKCDKYLAYAEEREKARAALRAEIKPYSIGRMTNIRKYARQRKRYNTHDE